MPSRRAKVAPTPARSTESSNPPISPAGPPKTLKDCLAPLAACAIDTSITVYKWGMKEARLLRASEVMSLCENIIKECNQLLRADQVESRFSTNAQAQEPAVAK